MSPQIRILLAEDHGLMSDAIASVLSREHELIAIIGNGNEILRATDRHRPEAVVLDVSMPGRSGLQVLPELRTQMPFLAIVILTAHSEPIYIEEAFLRGADGYVLKRNMTKDLVPTICSSLLKRQEMRSQGFCE